MGIFTTDNQRDYYYENEHPLAIWMKDRGIERPKQGEPYEDIMYRCIKYLERKIEEGDT